MAAQGAASAVQRARATILFADVIGFSALSQRVGPEEAYASVTGCVKLLDAVARRHGGSVDKYLGDCLMVVFGVPVAIEDAPGAAVRAALEMHECVRGYVRERDLVVPLELRIGINTGTIVSGDVRGSVIREFHVLGDAVNVAARLKERASAGQTYVGEATRGGAPEAFRYRPLEALELKGKQAHVRTFELLGPSEQTTGRRIGAGQLVMCPLIGRDAELARLRSELAALAAGRGGVVAVRGEEGLGKSRLIAELAGAAELDGVASLEGHALALARERPYHPFIDLLQGWAGIEEEDSADQRFADLEAAVSDVLPKESGALFPVLARMMGIAGATRRMWLGALRARRQHDYGQALTRLLRAVSAEQPLALVLEDLHDADPASLALLAELVPALREDPILWILTALPDGPEALEALLHEAAADPRTAYTDMRLAPLDAASGRRLIESLRGEDPLGEQTLELVLEKAGGNPFQLITAAFLSTAIVADRERAAETGQRSAETERRRTTVLFADISGFTSLTEQMDPGEAYSIVSGALRRLDDVARKHGGTVDKYHGDCVMAVFGAPVAIEDAPRAAVNAAIEMRKAVEDYNGERALSSPLGVHVGISTGLAIAGDVSGPLIREFAVMGDAVNEANHLKDLSPRGRIWVGPETHRQTEQYFEYERREPVRWARRGGQIRPYDLLSDREHLYRAPAAATRRLFSRLVGREEELHRLRARLAGLAERRGAAASLVGDAGLGKSRLVTELAGTPEAEGVRFHAARSVSIGKTLSFHPFIDLLRSWAGIEDDEPEKKALEKLRAAVTQLLPDEAGDVLPFVAGPLMGLSLPAADAARVEGIHGEALQNLILGAVKRVLQRAAEEQPLALVFEDLHWADLSSIELLESLLRLADSHPVFFLINCRPDFPESSGRTLEFARAHLGDRYDELHLAPLTARDSRRQIDNLFEHGDVPRSVRDLIADKAAGNPFYVEEVVRSLLDEGAVQLRDGHLHATERIHGVEIPGTLQEVVMARIDRLDLRDRHVLQVASVIGGSVPHEVLSEVASKDDLDTSVRVLSEAQLIEVHDRLEGAEYGFAHPLIQEVAYDSIVQARREKLHLEVARAIEGHLTENVPGYHAMLAYHFGMGRDLERAEEYLFKAGDEAAQSAASNEALHFFREAAATYHLIHGRGGDPEKKSLLEKNVALALSNRGQYIEAVEHFSRALRFLGVRVPRSYLALVPRLLWDTGAVLGWLYLRSGRISRHPASQTQREINHLTHERARAQITTDPTGLFFDAMNALRRLHRLDPNSLHHAGAQYAFAMGIFSFSGVSFSIGERLLRSAERVVDRDDLGEYLIYCVMRFLHHCLEGDLSDEYEIDDALLDQFIRNGLLFDATNYLCFETEKKIYQGRFASVSENLARLARMADVYGYDFARTTEQAVATFALMERGELVRALEAADAYYSENSEDNINVIAQSCRAEILVQLGRIEQARSALAEAEAIIARAAQMAPYYLRFQRSARLRLDIADLEAAPARRGAARRRARRSAARALRLGRQVAWRNPELQQLAGRLEWLCGNRRRALQHWRNGMAQAEALGLQPVLARLWEELAASLSSEDSPLREIDGLDAAAWRTKAQALAAELDLDTFSSGPALKRGAKTPA